MTEINNSKNKAYYTQRNNRLKPNGACNVTAMIAALLAAGYSVDSLATAEYSQPEDALMDFILKDGRTNALWQKLDPRGQHAPNEWHPVLTLGANLFLKERGLVEKDYEAVEWGEWRSKSQITETIRNGGAVVLSGLFPAGGRKTIGHVVACVGFREDDEGNLTHFIIDDSWGDYHREYADHNGNNVEMSLEDFNSKIRHCGADNKMAHLIKKAVAK